MTTVSAFLPAATLVARNQIANELLRKLEIRLAVERDTRFWCRRISASVNAAHFEADNRFSLRGSTEDYYLAALSEKLGKGYHVDWINKTYGLIKVSWSDLPG